MQIIPSKLLNNYSNILQGFTTKQNGNLAFHVGDDRNSIIHNHKKLANFFNYNYKSLVHMKQIHTTDVTVINETHNFSHPPICDALITDKKEIALMVMVADCSPLLFYDAKRHVIAVAHAGRAGAFHNIIAKTCSSFKENYNSTMENIYVTIGTSIKSCCYEVGTEIVDEAISLGFNYAIKQKNNSFYLDISTILLKQLLTSGIPQKNIEIETQCSACSDSHFSYRREKKTGREAGIIFLK